MRNIENKVIIVIMMGQLVSRLKKELANRLEEVEVRRRLKKKRKLTFFLCLFPLILLPI